MKALLVTTVERTKATTMGAETGTTHGIKVIPWKEVSEIIIREDGQSHTLYNVDGTGLEIGSFNWVDMADNLSYHEAMAQAKAAIKAMTPPPEPTNEQG